MPKTLLSSRHYDIMIPEKIGRYEIKGPLGRGGMATVYRAYDPHFEREVAVKVLPREFMHEPEFLARFRREAKTIAALEHPAIVPVYDYGEDNGQPYLVMRQMPGGSLSDRLGEGAILPTEAARILDRIGSALDRAHQQGIIHRDLKPSNILFDQYGDAFLADFGIVRISTESALTASGSLVGTPAYMSPEQVYGDKELDARSDIYALGIIVYQMLTGKPPYEADTAAKLMMKHVLDPVPHLIDQRPDLPPQFDFVLSKALAKDREERYPSATAFSSAIVSVTKQTERPSMPDVDLSALSPAKPEIFAESVPEKATPTPSPMTTVAPSEASEPRIPPPLAPSLPPPIPSPAFTPADTATGSSHKWIWGLVALGVFFCLVVGGIGAVFMSSLIGDDATPAPAVLVTEAAVASATDSPTEAPIEEPTIAPTATDANEALTRESIIAARETAVAEANATATPTTEAVNAAATRESLVATRAALANESATATAVAGGDSDNNLFDSDLTTLYGPENGEIIHDDDEFLESSNLGLNVADFIVSATIGNPYESSKGIWDFGIIFRQATPDDEMRLVTRATGDWSLNDRRTDDNIVQTGTAANDLNLRANETNQFTFIAQGDRGFFFLNGQFQDILDLSTRIEPGDLGLATGFYVGSELAGSTTTYDNFAIWPLTPEAGPFNGQLDHINDGLIKIGKSNVDLSNLIVDTTFTNPYPLSRNSWDMGFSFRDAGQDDELWIIITSSGEWVLRDRQDGDETTIGSGDIENLDTSNTGKNRLTLIVQDDIGYLLINDVLASELDLSSHPGTGDVTVMTAYFEGNEVEGEATRYSDFTVWALP